MPLLIVPLEVEKQVLESKKPRRVRQVKWYVSTDKSQLISYLEKKYVNKTITGSGDIMHIMGGAGYERALLDNEMLSLCDELIVTGGSSFGMLAAIRMNRMPLHFNGAKGSRQCYRSSLSNLGFNANNFTAF